MSKHVHLNRSLNLESQTSNGSSIQSTSSKHRRGIVLCEEFRLIERSEAQINGAWRGAHILLFFLAFIFGSFCTFCFHMLMYMFDDKCVLFPKLLPVKSERHNNMYAIMPIKDKNNTLQVEFVNAQWMDHSVCYFPVYVPLVSGIFGLVWITMFIMCSAGTRTHAGLHSPWRVLFPVFLFSVAMSILCVHSSSVTQSGLQAFCDTLSEITNGSPCSYAVNVVSLAYHRRIRGVYQATRLTIISAWFHTVCWLCSVALVVIRVILAVDFQLVRVRAELIGDIDLMLQRNEKHVRTISPESEVPKTNLATQNLIPATAGAIISDKDSTIAVKQVAADPTLKEDLSSKQPLTSYKSNIQNKPFPQTLPAKSSENIATVDVDNMTAATDIKNKASSYITPLFINSPVLSSSGSEYSLITPRTTVIQEPEQSGAEDNATKPQTYEGEKNVPKKHQTKADIPTSQKSEDDKQSSKAESATSKKVNINKYILTHLPSLDVTQVKEIVDHEKSRQSKDSRSKFRSSQSDIKASSAKLMLIQSGQRIKSDDQASRPKEPSFRPEKADESGWSQELTTGLRSPLSGKDDEVSSSKEPNTTPEKYGEASQSKELTNRPRSPLTDKNYEANRSTETISGPEKDGEASGSKEPTNVLRSTGFEKGDELSQFKGPITAPEKDGEAKLSKEIVTARKKSGDKHDKASLSKEPIPPTEPSVTLENDGKARRWSVTSSRLPRSDKYDDANRSKEPITEHEKDGEARRYKGPTTKTKSPGSDKDDKGSRSKEPVIEPEKVDDSRRWSVTRSRSPRSNKDDEANRSKEPVIEPKKNGEARPTTGSRPYQIAKDDEASRSKEPISETKKDGDPKKTETGRRLPQSDKDDEANSSEEPTDEAKKDGNQDKEQQ